MTAPFPTSRAANPDFVPSLRLLVEREQYSLTDIGMMFGVSRERARQWCAKYSIAWTCQDHTRGLMAVRIWDDTQHRFLPVRKKVLKEARRQRRHVARQMQRQAIRAARHAEILAVAGQLKADLGRDPALWEIARIVLRRPDLTKNQGVPWLLHYWGVGHAKVAMRVLGAELRAALATIGISPRPRGEPGHFAPRVRNEFCRRGHRIAEVGRFGNRKCNVCRRWGAANQSRRKRGLPLLPEPIATVSGAGSGPR